MHITMLEQKNLVTILAVFISYPNQLMKDCTDAHH
jgi:hypothetical protein